MSGKDIDYYYHYSDINLLSMKPADVNCFRKFRSGEIILRVSFEEYSILKGGIVPALRDTLLCPAAGS
jgi:hypothetical protein